MTEDVAASPAQPLAGESKDLPVALRPLFSQRTPRSVAVAVAIALVPWVTFVIGLFRKLQ